MEDGTSFGETTHELLLALAGRVDDDLLGRARELVAVGEDARAVELVTASLVAGRAVLPERVRSALVAAARAARTDLDPGAALPKADPEDGTEHRFAAPADDDPVAGALLALPARALAGCHVLLARRRTPAGSAPGPVPHPVVLVQAPAGGRPTEVLAYQIAVALERADVHASVEVLSPDGALSEYHAAALRSAAPVISADDAEPAFAEVPRPAPRRERETRPEPEEQPAARRQVPDTAGLLRPPVQSDALLGDVLPSVRAEREPEAQEADRRGPERREPARPVAVPDATGEARGADDSDDPATTSAMPASIPAASRRPAPEREQAEPTPEPPARPAPRPAPRPVPTPARIRRPTVTPISRTSVPNPIPLVRRGGPASIVRPMAPIEPEPEAELPVDAAAAEVTEPPARESVPAPDRRPADAETPAFHSLSDPLNGPLNEPLLAPLLDPTVHEDDPLAVGGRLPAEDVAPPARADHDDWSADWLSGTWAMAPSVLDGPPRERDQAGDEVADTDFEAEEADDPVAEAEPPAPRPAPGRPARHRYTDEPASPEPVAEAEPERPRLELEPSGEALGLRPESLSRLSDADRQLLARLQAELLEGRRPRVSRRAGIGNGVGPHRPGNNGVGNNGAGNNGSHRSDPPDLAG
ncbi:hypothetical protein GCM10009609_13690 [Pseudonocardia aurantiaca]|uniref:Uncharacterized protein n=1 Tax=Pseudonocardia aurantiaca TaxID=75290 RepID=A0ABW4FEY2_9PSEU